jgi:hypothetical protein
MEERQKIEKLDFFREIQLIHQVITPPDVFVSTTSFVEEQVEEIEHHLREVPNSENDDLISRSSRIHLVHPPLPSPSCTLHHSSSQESSDLDTLKHEVDNDYSYRFLPNIINTVFLNHVYFVFDHTKSSRL